VRSQPRQVLQSKQFEHVTRHLFGSSQFVETSFEDIPIVVCQLVRSII
jgi:hypothetical protein